DSDLLELASLERLGAGNLAGLDRVQHQLPDGVGENRSRDAVAFVDCQGGAFVVCSEEYLERSALSDLGIELTGCSKRQYRFVVGRFSEGGRDLIGGIREVRCNCHVHIVCMGSGYQKGRCGKCDKKMSQNATRYVRTKITKF